MGNFEKIIIKKERDKIRRETLGKFFFDLAKLVFAAIVLGEILLLQENVFDKSCWVMPPKNLFPMPLHNPLIRVIFTYLRQSNSFQCK